jgi:hypothetical protein
VSFARWAAILGGLLVGQLGLVYWTWRAPAAEMGPHRLFSMEVARVDGIDILSGVEVPPTPPPAKLEKRGGGWVIATADGFPTDGPKIADLLRHLVEAEVGAPIATNASSHAALRVGSDSYERKVAVHAGNDAVTVYLGTTTAGTANARLDGSDDVFTLRGLTVFDLGPEARAFAPTAVLDLDADEALSVTVQNPHGTFTLRQEGGRWTADVPVDPKKAAAFIRRATKLRLVAPVGRNADAAFGLDGSAHVAWTLIDGTTGGYTAGNIAGEEAWLQLDGSPFVVKVPRLPMVAVHGVSAADLAP